MSWLNYLVLPYFNAFDYSGRSRRLEYAVFNLLGTYLGLIAFGVILLVFAAVLGLPEDAIYLILAAVVIVPNLSLIVRRFHDLGMSGWYAFLLLIPFVNFVVAIILAFRPGQKGENRYGKDPKEKVGPQT